MLFNSEPPMSAFKTCYQTGRFTLLLSALLLQAACATLPNPKRQTTDLATHTYALNGTGPTVVFEAGLGAGKESWAPVYQQVSTFSRAFAYDRAGYGISHTRFSRMHTRDADAIVDELRATLRSLELLPPYILVGHSVGGTFMELFARRYPREVAGVVLIDSRSADFSARCRQSDLRGCEPPALLMAMMPAGPRGEFAAAEDTMNEVRTAGPFPNVPLAVLSSGNIGGSDELHQLWMETQRDLAGLSPDANHTICNECSHNIHHDDPELVIDSIRQVVEASGLARQY